MSYIPAKTSIQGRSIDILNIIRNNASYEYQQDIPVIQSVSDIPAVGQSIVGHPVRSNEFINALVNRIALVVANSALFRNPYEALKKGYLEYGESVEDIFVDLAKVQPYNADKAADVELKRTIPDVKAAFHVMNWKVKYPVTIQREELQRAFTTASGVEELIMRIIDSVYTAAAYDEFLLFKYLIIKNVANGHIGLIDASGASDLAELGGTFRGTSNMFTFLKKDYNFAGVLNNCPKENQYIFMDAQFNGQFDSVNLARAFNMDKADFMGKLLLIDDFTTFDNDRWAEIMEESDMVEEVTSSELAVTAKVVAVLVDERFFQIYDNLSLMTDTRVANGLYWNYFYHNWKIVATSPFANAVAFVDTKPTAVTSMSFKVAAIADGPESKIFMLTQVASAALKDQRFEFIQTEDLTELGVAVNEYGAITVPADLDTSDDPQLTLVVRVDGDTELEGTLTLVLVEGVSEGAEDTPATAVGDTIVFAPGA